MALVSRPIRTSQSAVEETAAQLGSTSAYELFGIWVALGSKSLSIARSVTSREGDIHAKTSGNLSAQTPDREALLDEPTYPRNGFLVGAEILRRELVPVDAIRPIG